MNVFVVVEADGDHVSLVDGDRLEVFHRFRSRPVLGSPVFTPDGRYFLAASRDGWIVKYDIWNLAIVAEARAGLDTSGLAVSGDGRWVMVANAAPRTLALLDPDLRPERSYPVTTLDGRRESRAAAVYHAAARRSFIVTLKDLPEAWEISYDTGAEPIFDGLVHDYRMGEAIAKPGYLGLRRIPLEAPIEALLFEPRCRYAIGAASRTADGPSRATVVNFDVRRAISVIPTRGTPLVQAGVGFTRREGAMLAFSSPDNAEVTVVDTGSWRVARTITMPGSAAHLSSHKGSRHVWADFRTDPGARGTITLIDKQELVPAGEVHQIGRSLGHVEFSRDGGYALATVPEVDGAVVAFDTTSQREVKRLPMRLPTGSYNVWNRIGRAGAS